ncbi:ficolin-1 [Drosophila teissieri]|uniref:ficolin-1 n=1 Tax=Drosophila teissieri TaxID=7243 RepID=UPI001CBA2171|nr:ficolin-1 [Drosophila teissieri]XP_043649673.1 ficolin-1 [Drosophila teissieri]
MIKKRNYRVTRIKLGKREKSILEFKIEIMKLEGKVQEKDEKLEKMGKILTEYTGNRNETDEFLLLNSSTVPSIKLVTLPDFEPFDSVFEDIPSAGRGWMVIQRRIDGSFDDIIVSNLKTGCGDLAGEFWIGLEKLHRMTTNRRLELYISLVDFDNVSAYARYDHFVIGGLEEGYKLLSLGKYSGNAGDAFRSHINETAIADDFTVFSRSWNLKWWGTGNCNLNGIYKPSKVMLNTDDGIWWGNWNVGKRYSLKSCKMLIRARP